MNRRLYRSRTNVMIGGVAAGLANYFDIDVTLVRLMWLLLVFAGGTGILAYIIAWIVIPQEPVGAMDETAPARYTDIEVGEGETAPRRSDDPAEAHRRRQLAGIVLVALGAFFLINRLIPRILHNGWPLIIVLIGLYLLYDGSRRKDS